MTLHRGHRLTRPAGQKHGGRGGGHVKEREGLESVAKPGQLGTAMEGVVCGVASDETMALTMEGNWPDGESGFFL